MADDDLTVNELRTMVKQSGITTLSEEDLRQLLRATNTFRSRQRALPVADLVAADEPAHIFTLVKQI